MVEYLFWLYIICVTYEGFYQAYQDKESFEFPKITIIILTVTAFIWVPIQLIIKKLKNGNSF